MIKKIIPILFVLLPLLASAQDFYIGKSAGEFLKEGMVFNQRNMIMTLQMLETNQQDEMGSPLVPFTLFCKDDGMTKTRTLDTLTFVPSLPYYPTHYVKFYNTKVTQKVVEFNPDGSRLGSDYFPGKAMYFLPNKKANFIDDVGISGHTEWMAVKKQKDDDGYREMYDRSDAEIIKEGNHYLDVVEKHLSGILEAAKTADYDKMMNAFWTSEGRYYLIGSEFLRHVGDYGSYRFDEFKVKLEKGENQNLSSLKMHFPYSDGNYYDKDNFYSTVSRDKNLSNLFRINDRNLIVADGYLVPFEDFLFVISKSSNGGYSLKGFISKTPYHAMISEIMDTRFPISLFSGRFLYEIGYRKENYENWFMRKSLATSYASETDFMFFNVFIVKYMNALVFKK